MILEEMLGYIAPWMWVTSGLIGFVALIAIVTLCYITFSDGGTQWHGEDKMLSGLFGVVGSAVVFGFWPLLLPIFAAGGIGYGVGTLPPTVHKVIRNRKRKKLLELRQKKSDSPETWNLEHELQIRPHHNCDPSRECRIDGQLV